MRTIRTPRLRLVPVTVGNAAALWTLLQQPDLRTYQDLPSVSASAFSDMVAKRPKELHSGAAGRFEWLLHVTNGRKPIGWVSLRIAERERAIGEIGYSIVRDHRGRGMASEAVRALVQEAFERANLDRVNAFCVPENAASRRVLAHVGFTFETTLPRGATVSGHPVDVLMHRLDRAEWRQSGNSIVMPASAYPA